MLPLDPRFSERFDPKIRESGAPPTSWTYFGNKVYKTAITRNVRLAEAPSFGKPIVTYDVLSAGAQAYLALAHEVIDRTASAVPSVHVGAS